MPVKNHGISRRRQEIAPFWPSAPSPAAIERRPIDIGDKAQSLTEALFSLEEPWQGRFLNLVANLATKWSWNGQRPTREEIAGWLGVDLDLCRGVKLLLDAWRRPAK